MEGRFDELLAKNADEKIIDVVEQCVSDIKQRTQGSEEQSALSLSCSVEETKMEKSESMVQSYAMPVK